MDALEDRTTALWGCTALFFVGGDLVTTFVGLSFAHVTERGIVPAVVIAEYGTGALIPLKLGVVGCAVALWWWTPRPHRVGVPLGLAALGVVVTLWNTLIILAAVSVP